jgi:hypothetical protein
MGRSGNPLAHHLCATVVLHFACLVHQIELTALCALFSRRIRLHTPNAEPSILGEAEDPIVELGYTNGSHFDLLYSENYVNCAAFCQSLIYSIIDGVSGSKIDRSRHQYKNIGYLDWVKRKQNQLDDDVNMIERILEHEQRQYQLESNGYYETLDQHEFRTQGRKNKGRKAKTVTVDVTASKEEIKFFKALAKSRAQAKGLASVSLDQGTNTLCACFVCCSANRSILP